MAYLNYENKRGSGKKLRVHFDLPEDDDYPHSVQRNSTSSNSSDSSLDSDDTEKDHNSIDNNDNNNEAKNDGNSNNACDWPVWNPSGSATQSPPNQEMNPVSTYDPNRIPLSVFARSPSPIEWSLASNESLFSLHLGNNSFSRELAFTFNKSGELPRTSDFGTMPMAPPPVQEASRNKHVEMNRHSVSSDTSSEEVTARLSTEDGHKNAAETSTHSEEAVVPGEEAKNYASLSYRSMVTDISARSFQFPILTADGGRSSSASRGPRNSSATVESEKHSEKTENHYQEEKPWTPPTPEAEAKIEAEAAAPKKGGRSWCYCCCCWSLCF